MNGFWPRPRGLRQARNRGWCGIGRRDGCGRRSRRSFCGRCHRTVVCRMLRAPEVRRRRDHGDARDGAPDLSPPGGCLRRHRGSRKRRSTDVSDRRHDRLTGKARIEIATDPAQLGLYVRRVLVPQVAILLEHGRDQRLEPWRRERIQVRNRATVVGNICRASPSADTIPPLVADEARIEINGTRSVALEEFFTGPGRTVLKPGELVTAILVPLPPAGARKVYIKHGRRKAMELATVGVAVTRTPSEIRIALGAVAPTVIRARAAEKIRDVEKAAQAAAAECAPISNVRASADYRREMVRVLVKRALEMTA